MRLGNVIDQRQNVLRSLHKHAAELACELPGRLGRIRVCSGDVAIEVEWSPLAVGMSIPAEAQAVAPFVPAALEPTRAGGGMNGGGLSSGSVARGGVTGESGPGESGAGGIAGAVAEDVAVVTAPLVGTFYHAPEPGAVPFVSVGGVVEAGATIGIVEAMKLLNPVTTDVGGTVTRVCVGNGEAVEFDQPLVEIAPRG